MSDDWKSTGRSLIGIALFAALMIAFFFWGLPAIKAVRWSSPKEGAYAIAASGDKILRIDTGTGDTWEWTTNGWKRIPNSAVVDSSTFKERYDIEVEKRIEKQRRNREESERRKRATP